MTPTIRKNCLPKEAKAQIPKLWNWVCSKFPAARNTTQGSSAFTLHIPKIQRPAAVGKCNMQILVFFTNARMPSILMKQSKRGEWYSPVALPHGAPFQQLANSNQNKKNKKKPRKLGQSLLSNGCDVEALDTLTTTKGEWAGEFGI